MNIDQLSQNFFAFAQIWDRLDRVNRIDNLIATETQRRFYQLPVIGYAGPQFTCRAWA